MAPYTLNVLNIAELAVKLAIRVSLSDADDLYVQQHNQLFVTGWYSEVANVTANSRYIQFRYMMTLINICA